MWKSLIANERTWVSFKELFQEEYLDKEELDQTSWVEGYGSANNVKHSEIEDTFMNFGSVTAACDSELTKLTTVNGNMSTKLR